MEVRKFLLQSSEDEHPLATMNCIVQKTENSVKKQQIFFKAYVIYFSLQIVNRRSPCTVNVCLKKLKKQTLIFLYCYFFPHLSMHIYYVLMLLEIRSKLL